MTKVHNKIQYLVIKGRTRALALIFTFKLCLQEIFKVASSLTTVDSWLQIQFTLVWLDVMGSLSFLIKTSETKELCEPGSIIALTFVNFPSAPITSSNTVGIKIVWTKVFDKFMLWEVFFMNGREFWVLLNSEF